MRLRSSWASVDILDSILTSVEGLRHLNPIDGLRSRGFSPIEFQIGESQRFAALLLVVVILVDYPRSTPFPEGTPAQCATSAGRSDQVKRPG
jgi:hypothetical protein